MGEEAVIHFNLATLTEECAIEIFTERGLLPKKEPVPLCPNPNCGAKMKASMDRQRKLGYGIEGLKLVQVEEPTVDSEEIGHLIRKRPKIDDDYYYYDSDSDKSLSFIDDLVGDPTWEEDDY
ncbi:hypothetical protein AVEN_257094-1 [Araneus ventricosus]|uniref:Uncharacterized protein n=1 Tax=Araneus ventricosus TaxID=182803 RepID=A0A4Y2FU94_ARAVE|nr:hypothetical protein AVEN_257094-1 [Araneus ventricosus]